MYIANKSETQLTAPGRTSVIDGGALGNPMGSYEVVVANIDTNVVIRVDESSEEDFGSDVVSYGSVTITANGTYVLPVYSLRQYQALNFVSESGGTAATIDATLRLNGK